MMQQMIRQRLSQDSSAMQLEQTTLTKLGVTQSGEILVGEVYGKQTNAKFSMYSVLKVAKGKNGSQPLVTLQNIDNPLSLLETTSQKLHASGYIRISQTPYINADITGTKKGKSTRKHPIKINRCPHTLDFIEDRADNQRPAPIMPDLFAS